MFYNIYTVITELTKFNLIQHKTLNSITIQQLFFFSSSCVCQAPVLRLIFLQTKILIYNYEQK